jgi:hypothetical protein
MLPIRLATLSGVPIEIAELKWPFHQSTSGSDWFVLHGRVNLLDATGPDQLHADVAVAMTQTMKDAVGSLEPGHAEPLVVNAIRKTIDNGQLAFLKSGKLQPVHITSRFYSFTHKQVQFPTQSESDVLELLKLRIFWLGMDQAVEIATSYDSQYVNLPQEKLLELAGRLAAQGLITISGDRALATDALRGNAAAIHAAMHKSVEAGKAATKISA